MQDKQHNSIQYSDSKIQDTQISSISSTSQPIKKALSLSHALFGDDPNTLIFLDEQEDNQNFRVKRSQSQNCQTNITNEILTKNINFDFINFKSQKCQNYSQHNTKQCIYYHSEYDKKRNFEIVQYSSQQCSQSGSKCSLNDHCTFSHNKLEILYHPDKFRKKFCQNYPDVQQCEYGNVCSFAHNNNELNITKLHLMEKNQEFYLKFFKTEQCPFTNHHDKNSCVYAHNIQDYRRDPKQIQYIAQECQNWSKSDDLLIYTQAGCNQTYSCNFCHGWKEYDYHIDIYKTRHCTFSQNCPKQQECPYYHSKNDQRIKNQTQLNMMMMQLKQKKKPKSMNNYQEKIPIQQNHYNQNEQIQRAIKIIEQDNYHIQKNIDQIQTFRYSDRKQDKIQDSAKLKHQTRPIIVSNVKDRNIQQLQMQLLFSNKQTDSFSINRPNSLDQVMFISQIQKPFVVDHIECDALIRYSKYIQIIIIANNKILYYICQLIQNIYFKLVFRIYQYRKFSNKYNLFKIIKQQRTGQSYQQQSPNEQKQDGWEVQKFNKINSDEKKKTDYWQEDYFSPFQDKFSILTNKNNDYHNSNNANTQKSSSENSSQYYIQQNNQEEIKQNIKLNINQNTQQKNKIYNQFNNTLQLPQNSSDKKLKMKLGSQIYMPINKNMQFNVTPQKQLQKYEILKNMYTADFINKFEQKNLLDLMIKFYNLKFSEEKIKNLDLSDKNLADIIPQNQMENFSFTLKEIKNDLSDENLLRSLSNTNNQD